MKGWQRNSENIQLKVNKESNLVSYGVCIQNTIKHSTGISEWITFHVKGGVIGPFEKEDQLIEAAYDF